MPRPRLKVMTCSTSHIVRSVGMILIILAAGCTSRYRVDLFLVQGEDRTKVKVEKTEFLIDAVLGDPMSRDKMMPGDGNCLVLVTGSRGRTLDADSEDLLSWDRYDRYRIFMQLPAEIEPGRIDLKDNSLVQMMGRYELPPEVKIYFPESGYLEIDSLAGKKLYGTIDGRFENRDSDTVAFTGQFRAKVSH